MLNPGTLTVSGQATLGPQAPTNSFTVSSVPTSPGVISGPGSFTVGSGSYESPYITFTAENAGTATLTINEPTGFNTPNASNWPGQITATVSH